MPVGGSGGGVFAVGSRWSESAENGAGAQSELTGLGSTRNSRIGPGSVMKAISRMSPPHAGHLSGNSSPTQAISLAYVIREEACERRPTPMRAGSCIQGQKKHLHYRLDDLDQPWKRGARIHGRFGSGRGFRTGQLGVSCFSHRQGGCVGGPSSPAGLVAAGFFANWADFGGAGLRRCGMHQTTRDAPG